MDLLRHLFFEDPTTLWILLGMGALVAGAAWVRNRSRAARWAVLVLVDAGLILGVVAWVVETDHERLMRTIDTMARAAADGQAEVFVERISPAYKNGPFGKDAVAAVVRTGLERLRATAETPTFLNRGADVVVTQVYRFAPAPGSGTMIPQEYQRVTWEGAFAPDADGEWRLRSAVATQPRRMTPEEAARLIPRAVLPR